MTIATTTSAICKAASQTTVTMTTATKTGTLTTNTSPAISSTATTVTNTVPKATTIEQPLEKIFLKSRDGNICAIGRLLPEQTVIHGQPLGKGNGVVSIQDIIQVGAKTWYPDKFGEDDLVNGAIVEWPLNMTSKTGAFSPIHTRSRKRI